MRRWAQRLLIAWLVGQSLSWTVGQAVARTAGSSEVACAATSRSDSSSATAKSQVASELAKSAESSEASESVAAAELVPPALPETMLTQADAAVATERAVKFTQSLVATDPHGQELGKGKTVVSGETIKYQFKINLVNGSVPLDQLKFYFAPSNYTALKTAQVTQANGQTSYLKLTGNYYDSKLAGQLDADNPWVSITVMVVAAETADKTLITEGGDAYISQGWMKHPIDLPHFMILALNPLQGAIDQHSYQVRKDNAVIIKGKLWRESGLQTKMIKLWVSKDGRELSRFYIDQLSAEDGFEYVFYADGLAAGEHELYLHARDTHNLQIRPIKITVRVHDGELAFEQVSAQAKFKPVTLSGQPQVSERQDDWQLKIKDTREANDAWRVTATADALVDAQQRPLAGELVYGEANAAVPLTQEETVVAEGQAQAEHPIQDVTAAWHAESGILLKTRDDAVPGNYHGKITWRLENVPNSR